MSNEANIQLLQESLEALSAGDADRFMATIHDEVTWSLDASKVPISGIKALHAVTGTDSFSTSSGIGAGESYGL